jgi:hypothetical protein
MRTNLNSQCDFHSPPESCDPSWAGKFRGAMWASEYEEGWLDYETLRSKKSHTQSGKASHSRSNDLQIRKLFERFCFVIIIMIEKIF